MGFKKGQPAHPKAGRPKGSRNKRTVFAKDVLEAAGVDLIHQILARIPKLSPENQVKYLNELMPYVYPKLQATEISIKHDDSSIDLKDVSDADLDAVLINAAKPLDDK